MCAWGRGLLLLPEHGGGTHWGEHLSLSIPLYILSPKKTNRVANLTEQNQNIQWAMVYSIQDY